MNANIDRNRSNIKFIYAFIIILIIVFIVLYFIQLPSTGVNIEKKGPYDLHESKRLYINNNSFQTNTSVSLQGFFYLDTLQKTGIVRNCSPTDTTGCADLDTGRFNICDCSGTDCSRCNHSEYVKLISINGDLCVLEVLSSPDAGRQNKAYTQLTVKTKSPTQENSISVETFILPPFPFQKWIMITINREGRRFDIYYNDTLVLSKLASSPLYTGVLNSDIIVGNEKLNGSYGFFTLYSSLQSALNISKQYKSFISTRESPLFDRAPPTIDWKTVSVGTISLDSLSSPTVSLPSIGLCLGSDCINNATTPPAKPFYEWKSSYA